MKSRLIDVNYLLVSPLHDDSTQVLHELLLSLHEILLLGDALVVLVVWPLEGHIVLSIVFCEGHMTKCFETLMLFH